MIVLGLLAPLGAAAALGLAAVLGQRDGSYAVVALRQGQVCGKAFPDRVTAAAYQQHLQTRGLSTIMLRVRNDGSLDVDNPVSALRGWTIESAKSDASVNMTPYRLRGLLDRQYDLRLSAQNTHPKFDTLEEESRARQITTSHEIPEWVKRARFGPYEETPDHRMTTSSHMWQTDVPVFELPAKAESKF
jgi:hypothetical protein